MISSSQPDLTSQSISIREETIRAEDKDSPSTLTQPKTSSLSSLVTHVASPTSAVDLLSSLLPKATSFFVSSSDNSFEDTSLTGSLQDHFRRGSLLFNAEGKPILDSKFKELSPSTISKCLKGYTKEISDFKWVIFRVKMDAKRNTKVDKTSKRFLNLLPELKNYYQLCYDQLKENPDSSLPILNDELRNVLQESVNKNKVGEYWTISKLGVSKNRLTEKKATIAVMDVVWDEQHDKLELKTAPSKKRKSSIKNQESNKITLKKIKSISSETIIKTSTSDSDTMHSTITTDNKTQSREVSSSSSSSVSLHKNNLEKICRNLYAFLENGHLIFNKEGIPILKTKYQKLPPQTINKYLQGYVKEISDFKYVIAMARMYVRKNIKIIKSNKRFLRLLPELQNYYKSCYNHFKEKKLSKSHSKPPELTEKLCHFLQTSVNEKKVNEYWVITQSGIKRNWNKIKKLPATTTTTVAWKQDDRRVSKDSLSKSRTPQIKKNKSKINTTSSSSSSSSSSSTQPHENISPKNSPTSITSSSGSVTPTSSLDTSLERSTFFALLELSCSPVASPVNSKPLSWSPRVFQPRPSSPIAFPLDKEEDKEELRHFLSNID